MTDLLKILEENGIDTTKIPINIRGFSRNKDFSSSEEREIIKFLYSKNFSTEKVIDVLLNIPTNGKYDKILLRERVESFSND